MDIPADPYFLECLSEAINTPGLVQEFDRLTGHNLSFRGTPLELMIDKATGRIDDGLEDFVQFVREVVYERCPEIKR